MSDIIPLYPNVRPIADDAHTQFFADLESGKVSVMQLLTEKSEKKRISASDLSTHAVCLADSPPSQPEWDTGADSAPNLAAGIPADELSASSNTLAVCDEDYLTDK